jgi:hypothetical protein
VNQTPAEKIINRFIANNPQSALEFLQSENIAISENPSLDEIIETLYNKYFENDKAFNRKLGEFIANGDNIGFVITLSIIVAVVSVGASGTVAAAKFNKDKRIAENKSEIENLGFKLPVTKSARLKGIKLYQIPLPLTPPRYKSNLQKRRTNAIICRRGRIVRYYCGYYT